MQSYGPACPSRRSSSMSTDQEESADPARIATQQDFGGQLTRARQHAGRTIRDVARPPTAPARLGDPSAPAAPRAVCATAGQPLTRAEWAAYLPGRAYQPP